MKTGKLISNAFDDIHSLYKKFIKWNICKILLFFYWIKQVLIPISIALLIIILISLNIISVNFFGIAYISLLISIIWLGITSYYFVIGPINLYQNYKEKNEMIFNFDKLEERVGTAFFISLIYLLFTLIINIFINFIIYILILIRENSLGLSYNILNFVGSIVSIFVFFIVSYVFFRFIFSYYILMDNINYKKYNVLYCISESLKITKGFTKYLKFILLIFLLFSFIASIVIIEMWIVHIFGLPNFINIILQIVNFFIFSGIGTMLGYSFYRNELIGKNTKFKIFQNIFSKYKSDKIKK